MKKLFKVTFTYIAIAALAVTIIFGSLAIGTVTSSTYKHYKNQYNECFSGYLDCISAANSATSSYYKASFRNLADTYSDLMDSWEARIDELEERAALFGAVSGVCLVLTAAFTVLAIKNVKSTIVGIENTEEQNIYDADTNAFVTDVTVDEQAPAPIDVITTEE